jgi:lipopolysaccharide/colanic/teichoic acid biosynthesis glycosyltransferase
MAKSPASGDVFGLSPSFGAATMSAAPRTPAPLLLEPASSAFDVRLVLTGATGFVAREIRPFLEAKGIELVLASRSWGNPRVAGQGVTECGLDRLSDVLRAEDVILHLGGASGDRRMTPEAVRAANVEHTASLLEVARQAGVRRFIYVSSFHALDPRLETPYAVSKREAEAVVRGTEGLDTAVLVLPAVHGSRWSGALSALNALPGPIARPLFGALKALKPTVAARRVAQAAVDLATTGRPGEVRLCADDLGRNPVYRVFRGTIDLGFVAVTGVALSWLMLLSWVAVRTTSRGPGFHVQERVGAGETPFRLVKLRTMTVGTPQRGTHEVSAASITPVGRLLRSTKLDELPQAWNVVRRELSVVGPRPCLPSQTELLAERRAAGVFAIRPGITGLAQVNGIDMSDPRRLAEWDHRYMHMRSILLDLRIVAATALGRGFGDPAGRGGA